MDNIMHTLARINTGLPTVDANGQPTGQATAQPVITTIAGPELDVTAQLRAQNVKLVAALEARDAEHTKLQTAFDAVVDD